MPKNPSVSNAAAIAACNEIVDALDESGGDNARVRIYDGSIPADVDTAITTQNLLAELEMAWPAFGNAFDLVPGAVAIANTISPDQSANASGTASWFRCVTKSGIGVIQGTVGTTDADMIVDNVNFTAGQTVQVVSFKYTYPETD